MKKITAIILLILMLLPSLSACSSDGSEDEPVTETVITYTLKEGVTLSGIVKDAANEIGIEMPMDVSEKTLESIFKIPSSAVSEFAGKFTISASSADNFLIVKAADSKGSVVTHSLEQRKQDLIDTFTGYIKESLEQATNAQIITRGEYYIFSSLDCTSEALNEFIDSYFDITETTIQK